MNDEVKIGLLGFYHKRDEVNYISNYYREFLIPGVENPKVEPWVVLEIRYLSMELIAATKDGENWYKCFEWDSTWHNTNPEFKGCLELRRK